MLIQNENYPTQRKVDDLDTITSVFEVQDVVHMGQLVNFG